MFDSLSPLCDSQSSKRERMEMETDGGIILAIVVAFIALAAGLRA
jgi:hypothetical protein